MLSLLTKKKISEEESLGIFLKLINNSLYSKMMEKVSDRVDIRLVTNSKGCLTLAWRPSYISKKVFNDKVKNNLAINDSTHIEYLHYIFTRPECMIFIITILKVNITIKLDYPLLMQWTMMKWLPKCMIKQNEYELLSLWN